MLHGQAELNIFKQTMRNKTFYENEWCRKEGKQLAINDTEGLAGAIPLIPANDDLVTC
jgi:hypothetical protein